ncbi:centrosomal protein of 89 kDa-like [Centruroides sculpturatus]|uniref:centrosomal protein of 89 kDa-like n=1 Tax=Centruroides sculpturatus TaxID=218467 RepID=UPI000C6E8DEB|nr:centrosomal protein of 89 kDa-like [Centruroides sculpturatus]
MEDRPTTPVPLPRRNRRNLVPKLKGILYTSTSLKSDGDYPSIASAVFNAAWTGQCIGYPINPDESGYADIRETDRESEPPSPPPKNIEDIYAIPHKSSTADKQCETSFSERAENSDMNSDVSEVPQPSWQIQRKTVTSQSKQKFRLADEGERRYKKLEKRIKLIMEENEKLQSKVIELEKIINQLRTKLNGIQNSVSLMDSSKQKEINEIKELKSKLECQTQQNKLLMEQILQAKKQLEENVIKVKKIELRNENSTSLGQDPLHSMERELNLWKEKYKEIKHKCEYLENYYKEWVPPQEHEAFVQETQTLLDKLKEKYQDEVKKLQVKVKELEAQKKYVTEEINQLKLKMNKYVTDKGNVEEAYMQLLQKCERLIFQLQENYNQEKELQDLNFGLLQLAEQISIERDQTMRKSQMQQRNLTAQVIERSLNIGRLQERLKEFRERTEERTKRTESRLREREATWKQLQNEYQKEMHNLKISLLEKDRAFNALHDEKSQLEQNLDALFQSIKKDNDDMEIKLRKFN